MKQTIKISLMLLLTLVFINCSKDDHLENHTHGTHNHNDEVSFKQFKSETGINKFEYYKKANISKSTDFQARTIESEFITDTTGIKKYVDPINNKTTYSFKIYPIAETLSSNEYYNLVYEKIGTEWNEIIFFNTEKTDSTAGGELESSEMVYNRISGREGFTEVITYSFHCTGCTGACDMCNLCVSTHVTYVYTGIEDSGDGSSGNTPGEGNPPSNGGGGEGNGIYIPNPYDGEADPNNADFMLAGQVASFINTLPNNLQTLISNYPFVYPYLVDFCRNNGYTVDSRNTQKMTTALTNFYNFQLNTSYNNLTFVNIDRFNFWAFYTFLNKNNNSFNDITPKINDIKSFVQAADHETANSTVDHLFENKEDAEAVDEVKELVELTNDMDKDCQALALFRSIFKIDSPFTNKIKNYFILSDVNNLNIQDLAIGESIGSEPPMPSNVGARVLPEPSTDGTIILQFNNNHLDNATTLGFINTFYHELVHAYILHLYFSGELLNEYPSYTSLKTSMDNFFNDSTNTTLGNLYNKEMHDIYIDFIDEIAESIVAYCISNNINGVDLSYAKKLVWGGLYGNDIFNNSLTPSQQNEATTLLNYENLNYTTNAKGTKTCE